MTSKSALLQHLTYLDLEYGHLWLIAKYCQWYLSVRLSPMLSAISTGDTA